MYSTTPFGLLNKLSVDFSSFLSQIGKTNAGEIMAEKVCTFRTLHFFFKNDDDCPGVEVEDENFTTITHDSETAEL